MMLSRRVAALQFALAVGLWLGTSPLLAGQRDPPAMAISRSGPFVYHSALAPEQLATLQSQLPQLCGDVSRYLRLPNCSESIEIHLLADEAAYRSYLRRYAPNVTYREALFLKDQTATRIFAYQGPRLHNNLRHECTHALLHAAQPFLPLWLDEGLAEYFELPADQRFQRHPHLKRVRWGTRLGMYLAPSDLERATANGEMGESEYRWSWAWVHFLLHESIQSYETLLGYLAEIRQGRVPESLSLRLQHQLPNLNRRFVQHFKSVSPE